jgi:hypothetical protein
MYIVKIVAAIKGIEDNMQVEILDAVKLCLKETFKDHGLFEIFVESSEEVEHI